MSSRKIEFFDGFTSEVTPTSDLPSPVTWEGAWVSGNYTKNEMVEYNGSAYVCILDTVSSEVPTNVTYWDLVAQKGDTGSAGATGADGASAGSNIEAKSADFTAATATTYLVDSSAARAITLPAAASGLEFWVKDSTGSCNTNNFTITRAGSESIEGVAANKTLQTDWGSWHFICDGTNWFMING